MGALEPKKILVVDDSAAARFMVRDLLGPMEAVIEEAADGAEAMRRMRETVFDLVITDMDMPVMNGLEFCRAFKGDPAVCATPAVMISTFSSDQDVHRGFEAGVEAYLSKGEVRSELLVTVQRVLSKSDFRQNRRILVVDDSASIRLAIEDGLNRAGFQVTTAENGAAALGEMEAARPDLILSDIDMPEMNGLTFCKAVKSDPRFSSIPFVVMSTSRGRWKMQKMIESGAASYITKPFHLDHLVVMVEKLLSDHVALLLKDRERLERERVLMLGGIASLISALEARDAYTRGHSEAVADILSRMVMLQGADRETAELAHTAGRLHDIGKIGVPDGILLKPGNLTDAEYEVIKRHPVIGKNILDSIPSLSEILPVVTSHHERWDGRGYPDGLEGEAIPLWARYAAVADTYHALVSDRPYRKGMAEEKALAIIRSARGSQLCPTAVQVFFKWYESSQRVLEKDGTFG